MMLKILLFCFCIVTVFLGQNASAQHIQKNVFGVFTPISSNDTLLIAGGQSLTEDSELTRVKHGFYPLTTSLLSVKQQPKSDWTVFPNPFNQTLTLQFDTQADRSIYLFDSAGKLAFEKQNFQLQSAQLNTSAMACGIYFLQIKDNETGTIFHQKLIRQ